MNVHPVTSSPRRASPPSLNPNPNPPSVQRSKAATPVYSPPYNWICHLNIDDKYGATGFKINLPHVNNYTVVVTAAHNLWNDGSYANKVKLKYQGKDEVVEAIAENLYVPPEYKNPDDTPNYDYGLIFYLDHESCNDGFGWTTEIKDEELLGRIVTICGYPADKQNRSMWITGTDITKVHPLRIEYLTDTMPGQSGSPIYTWYHGYWTVVGVHTYGDAEYNFGRRFGLQMISRFVKKMNCLKALRSVAFPDVYLRCYKRKESFDGEKINCQYLEPGDLGKFYIYPVYMPPSLAHADILPKFVIESANTEDLFLRLEIEGMTQNDKYYGGGKVYSSVCEDSKVNETEMFYLRKETREDAVYSFISVAYPTCRIRVDGRNVRRNEPNGSGKVNCQYYALNESTGPYFEGLKKAYKSAEDWEWIRIQMLIK